MRVEQRIGRIEHLGQTHSTLRIVNVHNEGRVETDVNGALRERMRLFETVVGRLQPILALLPGTIHAVRRAGLRDAAQLNLVALADPEHAAAERVEPRDAEANTPTTAP